MRSLLSQYNDPGPIFAIAGNVDLLPKIDDCKMSALDCKCHVPWHERDLWERRAFSQYKLPPPTSLWQSQSLKLPGGIDETIWVQQGAAAWYTPKKTTPSNVFSLGTIPQSHRASHGRELLSGSHMRAMFHACWTNWRKEGEKDSETDIYAEKGEREEEEREQSEEEEEAEEGKESEAHEDQQLENEDEEVPGSASTRSTKADD